MWKREGRDGGEEKRKIFIGSTSMEQVIAPITQFMTAAAVPPHISITSDMYRTLATHCSFREGTAKGSQCKHQLASGVIMWLAAGQEYFRRCGHRDLCQQID